MITWNDATFIEIGKLVLAGKTRVDIARILSEKYGERITSGMLAGQIDRYRKRTRHQAEGIQYICKICAKEYKDRKYANTCSKVCFNKYMEG